MQFKFLGDGLHAQIDSSFFLKMLSRYEGKTETEMLHEFQKCFEARKIMDGNLFFAKVGNPLKSVTKEIMYEVLSSKVYSVNKNLISNKLPTTWVSEGRKQGFVFKNITFRPSNFLVKDTTIWLKSDISIKKCGPLLHGCRLLDYTGRDFLYLFYNNVTREFRVEAQAPPSLRKMESLKTICMAAATAAGRTSLDYSILPLDLQCSIQHQLSPKQQMAFKGCFKTVKVWHSNQKLWQEIEYDVETQKYHGKARVWDSSGELILKLYFHQGLMHGNCVTMDSGAGGFPTSLTVFEHNVPIGERIRFHLIEDYKQTTKFQPGSCIHRIRFHTTFVKDDEDVGTDKEEHVWGLLYCDPVNHNWKQTLYDDEKTRDNWDSYPTYFKTYSAFLLGKKGFVPPCVCVETKLEAASVEFKKQQQKRKTISSSLKQKTFSKNNTKTKKIKFI